MARVAAVLLGILAAAPAGAAGPPIVLKAARLFDGKSDKTIAPGLVVVVDGKITEAGTAVTLPPKAQVIDLGNATLLPGFIDVHTHLTHERGDDWRQDELDYFKKSIAERTIEATANALKTVRAGFTTVRDLGAGDFIDVGLRNAIKRGLIVGPRMLVAINAIGARGGHCDPTAGYRPDLMPREPGTTDGIGAGPDEMRAAVRYNTKHGADVIKVCATGGVLSLTDKVDSPQLTQAELDALVDEAHALGRKAAAHAHGNEGAKRAIKAGIDSIEHGTFLDDAGLALMKQKGTALVPTPTLCLRVGMPVGTPQEIIDKNNAAIAKEDSLMARAAAKGVKVAFGSDAGVCPHGTQAPQFAWMVKHGLPAARALKSATSVAAELLGIADKVGTLQKGKVADVIAVSGDPLADITATERVVFVMRNGVVVPPK